MTDLPGPLLASGRNADVYDIGDGKVVRRYRQPGSSVTDEARVMRHLAERDYPVPTVHSFYGTDLVMDRIDGPTMLEALEAAPWKSIWYARVLAQLQRRLARLAAPDWLIAAGDTGQRVQSMLHLDLHPRNVIMSPAGPVVIDWTNAAGGPGGFDGALTFVEIATFSARSTQDRLTRWMFSRAFRWFRGRRVVQPYVGAACDHRLADPGTLPETRIAVAALRRSVNKQPPVSGRG